MISMNENKSIEIEIAGLEAMAICKMFNYGELWDLCSDFSAILTGGKVYAIIGEFGSGGWALSFTLAGMQSKYGCITNGSIKVNGQVANYALLKEISCYVGEQGRERKWFGIKRQTVRELIMKGTSQGKSPSKNLQEIVDLFHLTPERLDSPLESLSGERWNASMAIGYALGKKVYCLPWYNTGWMHRLRPRLEVCFDVLKKVGAIIVVPTGKLERIEDIVDEVAYIKGPNEVIYEAYKEDNGM